MEPNSSKQNVQKKLKVEEISRELDKSFDSEALFFESIIQNSTDAIFSKTLDGTITSWNKAAEELYGYTADEIIGEPIFKIVPKERYTEEKALLAKIRKGERMEHYETIRITKDGRHLQIQGTISPIIGYNNRIIGASAITRDVTEQKRIIKQQEFMIHASMILGSSLEYNKTLQTVANLAVDYIADWCAVDLLVGENQSELVAVAHKDPKKVAWAYEIRKMYPVDFKTPEGVGKVLLTGQPEFYPYISDELIAQSVKTKKDLAIIKRIGMKSIMLVPILIRNKPIGAITFVSSHEDNLFNHQSLKAAEDLARRAAQAIDNAILFKKAEEEIEERKKIEQALRNSEQKFRKLLDANIIGMIVTKFDGTIIEANKFFLNMLGITQKDLDKKKVRWDTLTPEKWYAEDAKSIEELKVYGVAGPWEKEYLHKNGKPIPVLLGCTMLDEEKGTVLTFVLDISEQKEIEQRKDDFISIASHELKTPITSMKVFAQLLAKRFEKQEDDQTLTLVNKLDTQLNKLMVLIKDLLDVSRIQSGKLKLIMEDFSLTELVKETVESLEQTTKHKIVIKDNDQIKVNADRERIGQVVTNFLTNAIKYSPDNKQIIVTIGTKDDRAFVGVQDFGIGISKEEQPRIFERFYQASPHTKQTTFPGLGMGLFISAEIIHRHQGKIAVESKKGKGSHFIFTIPLPHS